MSRSALHQFKIIAETYAVSFGSTNVEEYIPFFDNLVKKMYPKNLHRRQWARDNLEIFYNQEMERRIMWNELSSTATELIQGDDLAGWKYHARPIVSMQVLKYPTK